MTKQIKTYDFYRVEETTQLAGIPILGLFGPKRDRWYIDLPEWQGPRANLEMVAGADTLLDKLSNQGTSVNVTMSIEKKSPEGFQTLRRIIQTPPNGCMYHLGIAPVWLCNVTKFVFDGIFPKKIHFKVHV